MSKVTYPLAATIIILGLAVLGSHSASAQTFTDTSSMNATIDIMSCAGASEGLGKYQEYSTDQRTYSKELCDYLMQKYDIQCQNFELDANLCAKESYSYIKIQGYLQREGLKHVVNNGIQVIEKTVKVEVEEEDDDNDNDRDRNHKHRDFKYCKGQAAPKYPDSCYDRRDHRDCGPYTINQDCKDRDHDDKDKEDLPNCNDVEYGTHCDGSEDEDSWTDDEEKPDNDKEDEEEKEEEEEPEDEGEEHITTEEGA